MLASLLKKAKTSPVEQLSAYSTSPLSLEPTDLNKIINQRQKSNNFPLLGINDILHFKFGKSNFRILVLEDTGNLLSYDRYYVLYDSDIENRKSHNTGGSSKNSRNDNKVYNQKEIKQMAQYLFGSGFQGELKQTSRIHCEPKDLGASFKNKTLVVRTYHFDANFEYSLMKNKQTELNSNHSNNQSDSSAFHSQYNNNNNSSASHLDKSLKKLNIHNDLNTILSDDSAPPSPRSYQSDFLKQTLNNKSNQMDENDDDIKNWDIEPSTKIDFDFGSKNNTPIGICIVLPFSSDELFQTVGTNYAEFEKWLYEIQDLTLKYLKNYFHLQAECSLDNKTGDNSNPFYSSDDKQLTHQQQQNKKLHANRYFKVDNGKTKKIHFKKLLLQRNFEYESVFNNYYNRINIFMNTPRVITGITHLERNLHLQLLKDLDNSCNVDNPNQQEILSRGLCKEIREWLTIQDLSNTNHETYFLSTLLLLLLPLRQSLVDSKPADKKKQIVRLVLAGNNDTVSYRLLSILSCFLPDVIFKFDILNEKQFDKIKDEIHEHDYAASNVNSGTSQPFDSIKVSRNLVSSTSNSLEDTTPSKEDSGSSSKSKLSLNTSDILFSSEDAITTVDSHNATDSLKTISLKNESKESLSSACNSAKTNVTEKYASLSRSSTISNNTSTNGVKPYRTSNKLPMVPRTRGSGLFLMSPKTIPLVTTTTGYSNLFLDNGFYGSSAESFNAYSSGSSDNSATCISGININSNRIRKVSEPSILKNNSCNNKGPCLSSSFSQPSFGKATNKYNFKRVMSVTDLTQTSMNSSNAEIKSKLKKINFITRTPTAILNINTFKYSSFKSKRKNSKFLSDKRYAKPNRLQTGLGITPKQDKKEEVKKAMRDEKVVIDEKDVIDEKVDAEEHQYEKFNFDDSESKIEKKKITNRIVSIDNENYMKEVMEKIMFNSDEIEMLIDKKFNAAVVSVKSDINENIQSDQIKEQFIFDDYSSMNSSAEEGSENSLFMDNYKDGEMHRKQNICLDNSDHELFSGNYFNTDDNYANLLLPSTEIPLPPIVGITNEFFPEFSIQIVNNKLDNIKNQIRVAMKQDLFHNEFVDKCVDNCEKDIPVVRTIFVNIDTKEISELELKLNLHENESCKNQDSDINTSNGSIVTTSNAFNSNSNGDSNNEVGSYSSIFSFLKPSSNSNNNIINNNITHSYKNSRASSGMVGSSSSSDGSFSFTQSSGSQNQQAPTIHEHSRPPLISNKSVLSLFDFSKASSKKGQFIFEGRKYTLLDEKIFNEKRGLIGNHKLNIENIINMDNILKKLATVS